MSPAHTNRKKIYENQSRLRTMNITRDEEEHFKMSKNSVHQEDITILNTCVLYKRSSKYLQQRLAGRRENWVNLQLQIRSLLPQYIVAQAGST